jgi:membrane protein DedA with SNARE-associated domain
MMNRIIGFIGELLWAVIIFSAGFCIGSTYTLQEILSWGGFG